MTCLSSSLLGLSLRRIEHSFLNNSIVSFCNDVIDSSLGIVQLLANSIHSSFSLLMHQATILTLFQCQASKLLAMCLGGNELLSGCCHLLLCTLELLVVAIQSLLKLLLVHPFDSNWISLAVILRRNRISRERNRQLVNFIGTVWLWSPPLVAPLPNLRFFVGIILLAVTLSADEVSSSFRGKGGLTKGSEQLDSIGSERWHLLLSLILECWHGNESINPPLLIIFPSHLVHIPVIIRRTH